MKIRTLKCRAGALSTASDIGMPRLFIIRASGSLWLPVSIGG